MNRHSSNHWFQPLLRRFMSLRPVSWIAARTFHHGDRIVYGMSDGRFTMTSLLGGVPIVIVTTIGAKSGQQRSVPLVAVPEEEKLILVASNYGRKSHPSWYHNMRANPRVSVMNGRTRGEFKAHVVTGADYDRLWQKAVSVYGGYEVYKKRTGDREIPLVLLTPLDDAA